MANAWRFKGYNEPSQPRIPGAPEPDPRNTPARWQAAPAPPPAPTASFAPQVAPAPTPAGRGRCDGSCRPSSRHRSSGAERQHERLCGGDRRGAEARRQGRRRDAGAGARPGAGAAEEARRSPQQAGGMPLPRRGGEQGGQWPGGQQPPQAQGAAPGPQSQQQSPQEQQQAQQQQVLQTVGQTADTNEARLEAQRQAGPAHARRIDLAAAAGRPRSWRGSIAGPDERILTSRSRRSSRCRCPQRRRRRRATFLSAAARRAELLLTRANGPAAICGAASHAGAISCCFGASGPRRPAVGRLPNSRRGFLNTIPSRAGARPAAGGQRPAARRPITPEQARAAAQCPHARRGQPHHGGAVLQSLQPPAPSGRPLRHRSRRQWQLGPHRQADRPGDADGGGRQRDQGGRPSRSRAGGGKQRFQWNPADAALRHPGWPVRRRRAMHRRPRSNSSRSTSSATSSSRTPRRGDTPSRPMPTGRCASSANSGNGVGDISLIYQYMKMLDPDTGVSEGEYANAAAAAASLIASSTGTTKRSAASG